MVEDPRNLGLREKLEALAKAVVVARRAGRAVILQTGAHSIKNGLSPIWVDLMERGLITLVATNMAGAIHSFELALTGESSEAVDKVLPKGEFGMAFETGRYLNQAMTEGHRRAWGLGESLARFFTDADFRKIVLDAALSDVPDREPYYVPYDGFPYASTCVFARAAELKVPITVHAMIGTDITDQHANFDGEAKGATSARDFLIYTDETSRLQGGGVVLNVGTAVMGPEVLLKAVSMVTNQGHPPTGLVTGDFDIRPFAFDDAVKDEGQYYYYFRDQKTIATRLPASSREQATTSKASNLRPSRLSIRWSCTSLAWTSHGAGQSNKLRAGIGQALGRVCRPANIPLVIHPYLAKLKIGHKTARRNHWRQDADRSHQRPVFLAHLYVHPPEFSSQTRPNHVRR